LQTGTFLHICSGNKATEQPASNLVFRHIFYILKLEILNAMTRKIYIVFFAGVFSLISLSASAQDEYNKKKEDARKEDAINTNKKTPVKIIEYIVGTWQMDEVYKGKKDISDTDTVGMNQTITFDREGRFISYSGEEKIGSGSYRLNEDHAILYLESETGEPITEWNVAFSKEGMSLQPRDATSREESFKYIYTRTGGTRYSN
jgi:hypothetical protein